MSDKAISAIEERSAMISMGARIPDGDWPGSKEPGGMECDYCGGIYIGDEWTPACKVCWELLGREVAR